uniref:Uncharacterized protein n=1 Tax=Gibberella zeae TaxID=5518 RepID=A0A4E9ELH9_GIBZA
MSWSSPYECTSQRGIFVLLPFHIFLINCGRINGSIYHLSSFLNLPSSLPAEPSLSSTITSIIPLHSHSHRRIIYFATMGYFLLHIQLPSLF